MPTKADGLTLLFGARYDIEEATDTSNTDTRFLPGIPAGFEPILGPLEGLASSSVDAEYDAFLPKFGVQYAATDNTNLAFVITRGYRSGGAEIDIVDGTSLIEYDPEFITNYEFSTRSTLLDGQLTLNTNTYFADWTDQQVPVPLSADAPELTRTVNAGQSTVYGFEVEANYSPKAKLDLYGSLGYSVAEFEDFCVPRTATSTGTASCTTNGAPGDDLSGNSFPFAPEFSYNLGFSKFHDNNIFYGADVSYRGDTFTTNENEAFNTVPSYTVVNARLGYEFKDNYRVTLYARNLFDEDYLTQVNRSPTGISGTARNGDPRLIGIRLDANF